MKNRVIILGAGLSGNGTKELLDYMGVYSYLVDDKIGIKTEDAYSINLKEISYFVKSPGISWENEFVQYLLKNSIKAMSEIEVAIMYLPKKIKLIGFTGTNGKTTTCTKTYEMLKYLGKDVKLAGNVGISFASTVKDILKNNLHVSHIVLELSSYQLENNTNIPLYISGIINLTPDHLTRYKDVYDYYKTKFNIFNDANWMILNENDEEFRKINDKIRIKTKKIHINSKEKTELSTIYRDGEYICIKDKKVEISSLSLKGEHNIENMLFILATAYILDLNMDEVIKFLQTTKSLEHRMEDFYSYKNLYFINDSKATNIDSAMKAINSYNEDIHLILGGYDKKIDNTELVELVKKKVSFVYLIGENYKIFEELFSKINYSNYIYLENIYNVVDYIYEKKEGVNKKTIILFSPATSSFDQFKNFEERGMKFKEYVLDKFKED